MPLKASALKLTMKVSIAPFEYNSQAILEAHMMRHPFLSMLFLSVPSVMCLYPDEPPPWRWGAPGHHLSYSCSPLGDLLQRNVFQKFGKTNAPT